MSHCINRASSQCIRYWKTKGVNFACAIDVPAISKGQFQKYTIKMMSA